MTLLLKLIFILAILSIPCFSQQTPPSCIPDSLYQSYQTACNQRTKAARVVYLNTLASLQQECVIRKDFDNALLLKKALEQGTGNSVDIPPPSMWKSLVDIELKTESKWLHKITSDGQFYHRPPSDKEYRSATDKVDMEKSMPEAVIFAGSLGRKWLKMENGDVVQICHHDTCVEKLIPLSASPQSSDIGSKLADAERLYQMSCARATAPLTAKFITALEKIQKQALIDGKLDDCIKIKQYTDTLKNSPLGSSSASPSCLKGAWMDSSNILAYDFNDSGTMTVRTKSGQIEQQEQYARSSPAGGYFIFKITQGKEKGEERIHFPYDGKIYFLKADLSNWIRVLSPNSK